MVLTSLILGKMRQNSLILLTLFLLACGGGGGGGGGGQPLPAPAAPSQPTPPSTSEQCVEVINEAQPNYPCVVDEASSSIDLSCS